jgi:hypothetical protein
VRVGPFDLRDNACQFNALFGIEFSGEGVVGEKRCRQGN